MRDSAAIGLAGAVAKVDSLAFYGFARANLTNEGKNCGNIIA